MARLQEIKTARAVVRPLQSAREREEFLALPRLLRAGDPVWVEPLRFDQRRLLGAGHPFYDHGRAAEAQFFLARDVAGRPVGRIAAIVNHLHNRHAGAREGFFGFFDSVDDQTVSGALLDAAADWLRQRAITTLLGPASPSHNYEYGLLVEGFELPQRFMLAHNPSYYGGLLEAWGLRKARDLYAFTVDLSNPDLQARVKADGDRMEAVMKQRAPGVTVRAANMRHFASEVRIAVDLVNRALEDNWGYSPMTEGELKEMASTLRYLVDPELLMIAELRGEPIAMGLTMPDLNLLIKRLWQRKGLLEVAELLARFKLTRLDAARTIACGVVQDRALFGIGTIVMYRLYQRMLERGVRILDASWILEDNLPMLLPLKRFGLEPDRTYRIYQAAL